MMEQHEKEINMAASKEKDMKDKPVFERPYDRQSKRLINKIAVITGGDSGIGRAVCVAFAREGADVAIVYKKNTEDAEETKRLVEEKGQKALIIETDISFEKNCNSVVKQIIDEWGRIDIVVNNAAVQFPQETIEDITTEQMKQTFETNIFSNFYLVKAALPFLKKNSAIINTASVVAYRGNPLLLDYSSSKGAIVAFTRTLAGMLAKKKIRVNAVAPGPIWTPLIVSTFSKEHQRRFGKDTPMKRPGQPAEVAPAYVFLASEDASYISGQVIHINGGEAVNG
ncbi:SDR family oxidoreductase [Emticicia sp. BO119]|uniref:SDR family oxidoreductase n=1 Tax=Emticicia sp. BO119 TaxID=2757768 RepID=UPI0015F00194|nr:SDR family oxidoreductase [Emticicia sp. BO119]MBA4850132.1 SDR family oxidoreductase [Emticicia sp. BO119]